MDTTGQLDVYIVLERATKIAFFDFHSNSDDVKDVTQSIWGCTSVTQPLIQEEVVMQGPPDDLELLFHNTDKLKKIGAENECRTKLQRH